MLPKFLANGNFIKIKILFAFLQRQEIFPRIFFSYFSRENFLWFIIYWFLAEKNIRRQKVLHLMDCLLILEFNFFRDSCLSFDFFGKILKMRIKNTLAANEIADMNTARKKKTWKKNQKKILTSFLTLEFQQFSDIEY